MARDADVGLQGRRKALERKGRKLRDHVPRKVHAAWKPPPKRRDPIDILIESSEGRVEHLIPIRYGRMLQSPFAFFRGAAAIMAADLTATPATGIRVQACGDCHLVNFGAYATPERRVVFDLNDFDETLPAPWEWDLKRLAASFVVAGRNNGFGAHDTREAARACVRSYRERIAEYAAMRELDVWYAHIAVDELVDRVRSDEARKRIRKRLRKAESKSVVDDDFPKLTERNGREPVIRDNPPLIFHFIERGSKDFEHRVLDAFHRYRESLPDDRRVLVDRYAVKDFAMKVVGVGSVGTLCGVLLLMADVDDPLFLQVKEARRSVLEPYAGKSIYANHGQRVVVGQRIMQSASDLFLGWAETALGRHIYGRQLRDMKLKPLVEIFDEDLMAQYGEFCGWGLARAHARSGSTASISGYLGAGDAFDVAVADFAEAYADQNDRDYAAFRKAVRAGRVEVTTE